MVEYTENKIQLIRGNQSPYDIVDKVAGICVNRKKLHDDTKHFVEKLIEGNEMRPLEFSTIRLVIYKENNSAHIDQLDFIHDIANSPYSKTRIMPYDGGPIWYIADNRRAVNGYIYYVTTNLRVIIEKGYTLEKLNDIYGVTVLNDGEAVTYDRTFFIERPIIKFTCSRAIADEFRTHVSLSSMMKSTRYCKLKNNDALRIIKPLWYDDSSVREQREFDIACESAANSYKKLAKHLPAQYARDILPLSVETELVLCGEWSKNPMTGWQRFFDMRISEKAHPEAKFLAEKAKELIIKNYGEPIL